MPFDQPAARLRALGLRPRKQLSQSFLTNAGVVHAIVAAAALDPASDKVLEVGPGLGVMTQHLVRNARGVVAVELDRQLAAALKEDVEADNLEVVQADILSFDPSQAFDQPYVVVANLPYHVTSPAIRHLLRAGPPYARRLVVMVQREVAERISAGVGHLSALAVAVQSQATVRLVRDVPAGAFYPRPKVDSAVLLLEPLPASARPVTREDAPAFEAFLHAGFAQPRKQLANSLAQGLERPRGEVAARLASLDVDPARRPQQIPVPVWAALFHAFREEE